MGKAVGGSFVEAVNATPLSTLLRLSVVLLGTRIVADVARLDVVSIHCECVCVYGAGLG